MANPTNTNRNRSDLDKYQHHLDWRCSQCFKLLGKRQNDRVHVQFARGHQYLVSTPMSAVCRKCGTLNELDKSN